MLWQRSSRGSTVTPQPQQATAHTVSPRNGQEKPLSVRQRRCMHSPEQQPTQSAKQMVKKPMSVRQRRCMHSPHSQPRNGQETIVSQAWSGMVRHGQALSRQPAHRTLPLCVLVTAASAQHKETRRGVMCCKHACMHARTPCPSLPKPPFCSSESPLP